MAVRVGARVDTLRLSERFQLYRGLVVHGDDRCRISASGDLGYLRHRGFIACKIGSDHAVVVIGIEFQPAEVELTVAVFGLFLQGSYECCDHCRRMLEFRERRSAVIYLVAIREVSIRVLRQVCRESQSIGFGSNLQMGYFLRRHGTDGRQCIESIDHTLAELAGLCHIVFIDGLVRAVHDGLEEFLVRVARTAAGREHQCRKS